MKRPANPSAVKGALAAVAETLSSVSSTQGTAAHSQCNSSSRGAGGLLWPPWKYTYGQGQKQTHK